MDYSWIMHGLCMDCVWVIYGLCVDHVWIMYGLVMDYVWIVYGLCMDYVDAHIAACYNDSDVLDCGFKYLNDSLGSLRCRNHCFVINQMFVIVAARPLLFIIHFGVP